MDGLKRFLSNHVLCVFIAWLAVLVAVGMHSFFFSSMESFLNPAMHELVGLTIMAGIGESLILFLAFYRFGRYWGFWVAFGFAFFENILYGVIEGPGTFFIRFIQHGGHMGMWAVAVIITQFIYGDKKRYSFYGLLGMMITHAWNNGFVYAIQSSDTYWRMLIGYQFYTINLMLWALALWYVFRYLKVMRYRWPTPLKYLTERVL